MTLLTRDGKLLGELFGVDRRREHIAGRQGVQHAPAHDGTDLVADHRLGPEVGREGTGNLVEVEHGLAQHGELGNRSEAALAADTR